MRRTASLVAFLALVISGSAIAQPTVSVRGNVGAAFFRSPNSLSTVLDSGIDLGLETGIQLYKGFELVAQGSYNQFAMNEDNLFLSEGRRPEEDSRIEGGEFYFLNGSLGLRYIFVNQSNAHPYVTGGVGLYRSTRAELRVFEGDERLNPDSGDRQSVTSTGMHLALGVNFQINETYNFFFEPRYVVVYTGNSDFGVRASTRYVPVRLGIDMRF